MPEFIVIQPIRCADGRDLPADARVTLSPRQAKYLQLAGKVRPAAPETPRKRRAK